MEGLGPYHFRSESPPERRDLGTGDRDTDDTRGTDRRPVGPSELDLLRGEQGDLLFSSPLECVLVPACPVFPPSQGHDRVSTVPLRRHVDLGSGRHSPVSHSDPTRVSCKEFE